VSLIVFRIEASFAPGSFGGILWKGGFEGGFEKEYSECVGCSWPANDRKVITSNGAGMTPRCGSKFYQVKLGASDTAYNHNRNEIGFHPYKDIGEKMEGKVRYYGWSMGHSKANPLKGDSTYELAYWEANQDWKQTIGFYISDGRTLKLRLRGNYDQDVGLQYNFEPGKWHDFVLGMKWSPQASDGWVSLWVNGEQVMNQKKWATVLWSKKEVFSHLGIFRIPKTSSEVHMFYDCVVYAESFDPNGKCYNDGLDCGATGGGGAGGDDEKGDNDDSNSYRRRRRSKDSDDNNESGDNNDSDSRRRRRSKKSDSRRRRSKESGRRRRRSKKSDSRRRRSKKSTRRRRSKKSVRRRRSKKSSRRRRRSSRRRRRKR